MAEQTTRKINRLNDFFFKNLMGDSKRSKLTLRFLNLILDRNGADAFTSVEFLNKEQEPLTLDGKLSILDIKASVDNKTFVDIEVQVARENFFVKRSMYYLSRMYSEQAVKKQNYEDLKPVIGINLLDFRLFKKAPKWHNRAKFILTETGQPITDCITLHFLELPKLKYSDVKAVKKLDAWGAYFAGAPEEELEVLYMNEPLLKEAISYEKMFANNNDMYRKYQQREDAIRDENTKIIMSERRGIAIGKKQGIAIGKEQGITIGKEQGITIGKEQGITIGEERQKQREKQRRIAETKALAKKMLDDGMPISSIAKYTNLSIDEIENLK